MIVRITCSNGPTVLRPPNVNLIPCPVILEFVVSVYVVDVKAAAVAENFVNAVIAPLLFAIPNGVVVCARKSPVVAVSFKLLIG